MEIDYTNEYNYYASISISVVVDQDVCLSNFIFIKI